MRRRRVLPGFGLSLGTSVLFVSLVLLLPMTALVVQLSELTWAQYWAILTHPQTTAAFRVTILSAFWASVINALLGLLLAWILVRYRFPGRRLLDGLIDLPFVLPTAVAGLTLSALFAADGWYGAVLAPFGIKVSYTWLGIVAAMAFTSIPFVVRSVQPVLAEVNRSCEEAALTLGASRLQIFRRVILPEIAPALVAGTVLAYGAVAGAAGGHCSVVYPQPRRIRCDYLHFREYCLRNGSALARHFHAAAGIRLSGSERHCICRARTVARSFHCSQSDA